MHRAVRLSAARVAALLALAVLLAHVHPRHRPATLCLLRAVTGIPCPLCGGTTAAAQVGAGDLAAALRSSPLAVLGTALVTLRPLTRARPARPPSYLAVPTVLAALVASELWQLHRFGWL